MCKIRYIRKDITSKLQILLTTATTNKQTFCLEEHLMKEERYRNKKDRPYTTEIFFGVTYTFLLFLALLNGNK